MVVSIIIINYNTFSLTCQCIQHVVQKTTSISYEIILVDNASTECEADKFVEMFPNIRLLKSTENVGFARGNNLGIAAASGDYILLLNSDAFLANDAVGICHSFLKMNPTVAVATGLLNYPDGRVQHNCQRFPSVLYQLIELVRVQKLFPILKQGLFGHFFNYETVAYPDWVWGTFFMFRKELLNQLPSQKLPDDFFMYVEDMQWCMEFRKLGYKIAFCPGARVIHLLGGSNGQKEVSMQANHDVFMKLYYPAWKRPIIRALHFLLTSRYAA